MLYYIFSIGTQAHTLGNNNFMHVANKSCAVKRCIFIAPAHGLLFSDVCCKQPVLLQVYDDVCGSIASTGTNVRKQQADMMMMTMIMIIE